ncbi:MAG: hypothetical protein J5677_00155 [Bacteroidales bacterium]|nr:hypothetical protein [Bacteroidales bacterium]
MINKEFQELMRQHGLLSGQMADIHQKMKDNLLHRNGNKDEYTFQYNKHETIFISRCNELPELLAINADMCHYNR